MFTFNPLNFYKYCLHLEYYAITIINKNALTFTIQDEYLASKQVDKRKKV